MEEKIKAEKRQETLYWFQSLSLRQCLDAVGGDRLREIVSVSWTPSTRGLVFSRVTLIFLMNGELHAVLSTNTSQRCTRQDMICDGDPAGSLNLTAGSAMLFTLLHYLLFLTVFWKIFKPRRTRVRSHFYVSVASF